MEVKNRRTMEVKTEIETEMEMKCGSCVRGLCFHPRREWILVGLETGCIQLWDYRRRYQLEEFEAHDGPIRGLDFHRSKSIFVSGGGDDYSIKVWDFDSRSCFSTLLGHNGSINTVQFHPIYTWIVSSGSDSTIRLWNYKEGTCISTLRSYGCVTSAFFHLSKDLVLSTSTTDTDVRVWEVSPHSSKTVKHEWKDHGRAVRWACFHPTDNLIVSAADDAKMKLWNMDDICVAATLEGHQANITCLVFLPQHIVSASQDKTILIWDLKQREVLKTIQRDDQFWVVAKHPETNQVAAGHDSGVIIFKAGRERPTFVVRDETLFYATGQSVIRYDFETQNKMIMFPIDRQPRTISTMTCESGELLLFLGFVIKDEVKVSKLWRETVNCLDTIGEFAVAIDDSRFAVLPDSLAKQVNVCNLTLGVEGEVDLPDASPDGIFYGGKGKILCSSSGIIFLIDTKQNSIVTRLKGPPIKQAIWSKDVGRVALLSKYSIILADRSLVHICTIKERIPIKSGAWDAAVDVFVYTTKTQIKYCLPNGETGIIKTLDKPAYIIKISKDTIHCLDKECSVIPIPFDAMEYNIKIAVHKMQGLFEGNLDD